jgi:hypothetical protein
VTLAPRRALLAGVALLALVAGTAVTHAAPTPAPPPRVVVAVIDSGVNPYHEFFHRGGPLYGKKAPASVTPDVLKELGIGSSQVMRLTRTGDFDSDFERDEAQWDRVQAGRPYWFAGTNVIGISFASSRLRPERTTSAHGVGTAAAVLAANPDAIVIAVEGITDASEEWAFEHPAVDIVSTSYGPLTSAPTLNHLTASHAGVVVNGKAHVGAAANDPTYSTFDETSGPWWSIGVAGFEEGTSDGRQVTSGNVADFVGDFTQDLPYCWSCEKGTRSVGGTSFATPRTAGTLSRVVLEARRAAGHRRGVTTVGGRRVMVGGSRPLSVWQLRRALEEAAAYPRTADYSPDPRALPVPDAAPWTTTGWGLVSPAPDYRVVDEALAHLGVRGRITRRKPAEACEFMTANMQARRAYWQRVAVLGDGAGDTRDPYLYC